MIVVKRCSELGSTLAWSNPGRRDDYSAIVSDPQYDTGRHRISGARARCNLSQWDVAVTQVSKLQRHPPKQHLRQVPPPTIYTSTSNNPVPWLSTNRTSASSLTFGSYVRSRECNFRFLGVTSLGSRSNSHRCAPAQPSALSLSVPRPISL